MSQLVNFRWPQGEDFNLQLLYKEGKDAKSAKPVDLSGYSLRMSIVSGSTVLYTFDSTEHPGTLGSGADGANINIFLDRDLTLADGELFNQTSVQYDIFLRNVAIDRQVKLLRGSITIEKSYTLWA